MNMSGATHEYAKWASRRLRTRKQSLLATMALGIIIFVDDYFNCLTVGTVRQPIADKHKISREKLAYIIDSTAAPICIIAPISSWAAAVSSSLPDGSSIDGFQLFMKSIFCNYYSWLSLGMILLTVLLSVDFGKMKEFERKALNGKLVLEDEVESSSDHHGKVIDLLLPVVALIVLSIVSMLYTGGFFGGGISIGEAFANFFIVALLLAFSTGTSWGTFAILLPITVSVFGDQLLPLTAITTAAVLGGAVCGDHISPISDTTILCSTGAGCEHINHVSTQMQYGLVVAVISAICYLISGFTENGWDSLLVSYCLLYLWLL